MTIMSNKDIKKSQEDLMRAIQRCKEKEREYREMQKRNHERYLKSLENAD
jgi:hypothetical protein